MSRKTVDVKMVLDYVNGMLVNSVDDAIELRRGAIHLAESLLHSTGNYNGFTYLNKQDMKKSDYATTVGVNVDDNGSVLEIGERFEATDDTRRRYV